MGATARPRWRRAPGSLALLTTLVVLSSFLVIAGAQVASAAQCGQVNNPPACSLAFRFENPAKSGVYTPPAPGYSSPHQAAVGETIRSTDLDPSGPPVTVEVEDIDGHRDINYGGQITVTLCGLPAVHCPPTPGEAVNGSLNGTKTVTAVNGAASFTDLNIDTKGYFQLYATASGASIAPTTSGTFRIQADRCGPGEICTDSFQTLMTATLTNNGTGTVALSVGIDGVDPLAGGSGLTSCSTDGTLPANPPNVAFTDPFFHAPAETTVDEVRASGINTKVVTLRIDKGWRQMVVDKGTTSYRGCVSALEPFLTWPGNGDQSQNSPLIFNAATGEFTGLVPDCGKIIQYFCRDFVKSNKSGDVLEGLRFPAGVIAGDPRGH